MNNYEQQPRHKFSVKEKALSAFSVLTIFSCLVPALACARIQSLSSIDYHLGNRQSASLYIAKDSMWTGTEKADRQHADATLGNFELLFNSANTNSSSGNEIVVGRHNQTTGLFDYIRIAIGKDQQSPIMAIQIDNIISTTHQNNP